MARAIALLLAIAFLPLMPTKAMAENAHDFRFTAIEGGPLPLSKFRGKAVLVVNTASFCGFTRQYGGLQSLWDKYRKRGLVVLGVPSNDFGQQEPGTAKQIKHFCEVNFAVNFPMTDKVHVLGSKRHAFYAWAEKRLGAEATPQWNFHKYLVGPDGELVGWFPTTTRPDDPKLVRAIEEQLDHIRSGS